MSFCWSCLAPVHFVLVYSPEGCIHSHVGHLSAPHLYPTEQAVLHDNAEEHMSDKVMLYCGLFSGGGSTAISIG